MKASLILCLTATSAILASCNPERGQPRGEQLEKTAEKLEAKAGEILENVERSAIVKEEQASGIREEHGDEKVAEALEKDADVTREVGKTRADQLEEQAEKVREQKEDLEEQQP